MPTSACPTPTTTRIWNGATIGRHSCPSSPGSTVGASTTMGATNGSSTSASRRSETSVRRPTVGRSSVAAAAGNSTRPTCHETWVSGAKARVKASEYRPSPSAWRRCPTTRKSALSATKSVSASMKKPIHPAWRSRIARSTLACSGWVRRGTRSRAATQAKTVSRAIEASCRITSAQMPAPARPAAIPAIDDTTAAAMFAPA